MNRATQGDVVAVEVFPESEWKASTDEVVDQESKLPCYLNFKALKANLSI